MLYAIWLLLTCHETILYYSYLVVYNLWFHPLSKYPGPLLAAASPLWMISTYFGGRTPYDLAELHEKYGPVVRTSPDGLSFVDAARWRDIYGHKAGGQLEFSKDPKYFAGLKGEPIIINADRHEHGAIRRLIANGFSEKSLREQETILRQYVEVMFRRLHEESRNGQQPLNMVNWYNVRFGFIKARFHAGACKNNLLLMTCSISPLTLLGS